MSLSRMDEAWFENLVTAMQITQVPVEIQIDVMRLICDKSPQAVNIKAISDFCVKHVKLISGMARSEKPWRWPHDDALVAAMQLLFDGRDPKIVRASVMKALPRE